MPREFRNDIQALRGLAVLLVVVYHARIGPLTAGYVGVDIFFVISGFLITKLVSTQLEKSQFSFSEFYYRRAKRLLPAAYVVIALTTIAAPFLLSDVGLKQFNNQVIGALTFSTNIVAWFKVDYFGPAAETMPLLHFWSLSVEEQYYLLLPLFLALAPRRWWLGGITTVLVASLALCFYLAPQNPSAVYYLLPTRSWELAIGSLGALLPTTPLTSAALSKLRLPALALLLLAPMGFIHPVANATLVSVATLGLLLAPTRDNVVVRGMARIGDISYSLYLIHWPVLVYVRAVWLAEPPAVAIYSAVAFSFAASWALYRFVEELFRRGHLTSRAKLTSGLVAASIFLGLSPWIASAAIESKGDFAGVRRINYGLGRACDFMAGSPPQDIPKNCQTTGKPQFLIWGDSFAMALVPGLAKTVGEGGLAQLTMSGCLPAIGVSGISKAPASPFSHAFGEQCIRFNDSVLAILKNRPEITTVAISSPFDVPPSSAFMLLKRSGNNLMEEELSLDVAVEGIKALVEAVRVLGKRVVVVAPPPVGNYDIGNCLERKARGAIILGRYSDCKISVSEYRRSRSQTLELLNEVAARADVEVVSYHDFLCDSTTCKTEIDGKFLYRDSGHLSYEGSEVIARQTDLAARLIRAAR
ncbi:acyltransferase 3 family protein (plasmid) [Rhizobium etli]|uniref:Acyltransferase 3 family protein n=1 Tax=Rhizobium etli TaxID=29449 RepID=A0AAN1BLT1_RHIET|nr:MULTISPECIES: acyltransferase family protein [Rhizobium]ARO32732.1 acyltransferase 3 family protein [Rhizobium sp. NXC14]ARQ13539.1 acyltransferase 3 family protein [Rhizobium etli]